MIYLNRWNGLVLACVLAACSDSSSKWEPSPHASLPIVPTGGGEVFAHVHVVATTFAGDPNQDALVKFTRWLVTSSWYAQVGTEYGIGPGTVEAAVVSRPPPAPGDSAAVESFLRAELAAGELPAPMGQTAYLLYFSEANSACSSALGYHGNFFLAGGSEVVYAIASFCPFTGATGLQGEQLLASHELVETVTNPLYNSAGTLPKGYQITDPMNPFSAWAGELADLCIFTGARTPAVVDSSTGYYTQRIWSNAAALAGHQPCVPSWTESYYNVSANPLAPPPIAPGGSLSIALTGWSAAASEPWSLQVVPSTWNFTPTVDLDRSQIADGDTATLTVRVGSDVASGQHTTLFVYSSTEKVPFVSYWPIEIRVQ
jgi:hypothetical protein